MQYVENGMFDPLKPEIRSSEITVQFLPHRRQIAIYLCTIVGIAIGCGLYGWGVNPSMF
jgi:hypothetical protein